MSKGERSVLELEQGEWCCIVLVAHVTLHSAVSNMEIAYAALSKEVSDHPSASSHIPSPSPFPPPLP
jgi:hypothetical protein